MLSEWASRAGGVLERLQRRQRQNKYEEKLNIDERRQRLRDLLDLSTCQGRIIRRLQTQSRVFNVMLNTSRLLVLSCKAGSSHHQLLLTFDLV